MNGQSFHQAATGCLSSSVETIPLMPFYSCSVAAGFPSPADDYIEKSIDLNQELIANPVATFFVRVKGDSMKNASIHNEDVLIVDRSLAVRSGDIVVAVIDGELTVKRFHRLPDQVVLRAENPDYPPLVIASDRDFSIWGVVTTVIHCFKPTSL